MESRNTGLDDYPGLKTYSDRARAGAAAANPDVTSILPGSDWQAQHNIPVQVIKENLGLFGPASQVEGGFRTDGAGNMTALPKTPVAQQTLADQGISAPVHNGSHPDWTNTARAEVQNIEDRLTQAGLKPGMDGYAERANELIQQAEAKLRQTISALGKVK